MPRYTPAPLSDAKLSLEDLARYTRSELAKLSDTISLLDQGLLTTLSVAPAKPRTGQLVYADGTNWNPSGSGAGPAWYSGSAWRGVAPLDAPVFSGIPKVEGPGTVAFKIRTTGAAGAGLTVLQLLRSSSPSDIGWDLSSNIALGSDEFVLRQLNQDGSTIGVLTAGRNGAVNIGGSPQAWSGVVPRALQVAQTFIAPNTSGTTGYFGQNCYFNGSQWVYINTGAALLYGQTAGDHIFYTGGPGTAGTQFTFVEKLRITLDGRLYGTALHNNANSIAGTASQYIASGSTTPSTTIVANITSRSFLGAMHYIRVGNVVSGGFVLNVAPTAAATKTQLRVALPIASSFANAGQASGSGGSDTFDCSMEVEAAVATGDLLLTWYPTSNATCHMSVNFSYEIV